MVTELREICSESVLVLYCVTHLKEREDESMTLVFVVLMAVLVLSFLVSLFSSLGSNTPRKDRVVSLAIAVACFIMILVLNYVWR